MRSEHGASGQQSEGEGAQRGWSTRGLKPAEKRKAKTEGWAQRWRYLPGGPVEGYLESVAVLPTGH